MNPLVAIAELLCRALCFGIALLWSYCLLTNTYTHQRLTESLIFFIIIFYYYYYFVFLTSKEGVPANFGTTWF